MTMDPEERLAALESQVRTLTSRYRRSSAREAQRDVAALESRLAPSLLPPDHTLRSAGGRTPELGTTLMDRLRDDSSLSHPAGSSMSALASSNILGDPRFDFTKDVYLTTSWQDIGGYWEARYVVDSGTAPLSVRYYKGDRANFARSFRGELVFIWSAGAGAAQATVQLRSRVPAWHTDVNFTEDWPFIVATSRLKLRNANLAEVTSFTATISVIDSDDNSVQSSSDATDLLAVDGLGGVSRAMHPYVSQEGWAGVGVPQYQLDATMTIDAASIVNGGVDVSEPQVNLTDEETPPPFEPQVSNWSAYPEGHFIDITRDVTQTISDSSATQQFAFPNASHLTYFAFGDFHDPTNNSTRFYAPWTGFYDIFAWANWTANSSGARMIVIDHSSGTFAYGRDRIRAAPTGNTVHMAIAPMVYLEEGSYFEVRGYQDSGGPLECMPRVVLRLVAWMPNRNLWGAAYV